MVEKNMYCAIRKTKKNLEWMDTSTLTNDVFQTQLKIESQERNLPNWYKDNPLSRIVEVKIVEVESVQEIAG